MLCKLQVGKWRNWKDSNWQLRNDGVGNLIQVAGRSRVTCLIRPRPATRFVFMEHWFKVKTPFRLFFESFLDRSVLRLNCRKLFTSYQITNSSCACSQFWRWYFHTSLSKELGLDESYLLLFAVALSDYINFVAFDARRVHPNFWRSYDFLDFLCM